MAVVRLKFPDRGAVESVAQAMESVPDDSGLFGGSKRAAKEIRRASQRPGLAAELTAEEMILLGEQAGLAFPRVRPLLREKAEEAAALLEEDARELKRRREMTARIRAQHAA